MNTHKIHVANVRHHDVIVLTPEPELRNIRSPRFNRHPSGIPRMLPC